MPVAIQVPIALYDSAGDMVASVQTVPQIGGDFDHLQIYINLTIGILTSVDIAPEFSLDGSTWWPVYDANGTVVTWQYTTSTTTTRLLGQADTNTRMQPLAIAAPLWRLDITATGTLTGSSLTLDAVPFTVGGVRQ